MKKHKILTAFICFFIILVSALSAYVLWDNKRVVNTSYTFESERVPEQFDGFKIVLITDFHNGDNYGKIENLVRNASPDIICIAGDLVSMDTVNYFNTKELIHRLMNIAQVYYVYGNHEYYNATYRGCEEPPIKQELLGSGVIFLNNSIRTLEKDGALINLIGYGDSKHSDSGTAFWQHAEPFMKEISASIDKSVLSILLMHRAQYFDKVSQYPFDLVLGGHLHGGQINIKPIRDKILIQHSGTDKYSKGEYFENGHELIVSAGCADNDGLRILNTPEIVSVILKRAEK